jgi:hypothetical protein
MKTTLRVLVVVLSACGVKTDVALVEDTARLHDLGRLITAVCEERGAFPTDATGRADLYVLVRDGWISMQEMVVLLRSRRFAEGPSLEEVQCGSYEHLAYVRYRGSIKKGVTVPLLWDKKRPGNGRWLAGFSDGSVMYYGAEEFDRMLAAAGQDR